MGAALLAVGIELLIGIVIGLIVTVIGLFFGNIIVFDSIALAILAGFLSHGLLGVHPALAVVIGIAVLLGFLLLHCTRPGFWLIGGGLSVVWGFIFATMAYEFSGKDMVWTYVVWVLGAILVFALHLRARYKIAYPNFMLNEVSFAVYEDCITGFIGANGAGKTTTIRSILNLISCEAGSIKFKGKDTKKAEKTFKDSIGVVFDEGFFYDELTLTQMKNLIASSYSQWDNGAYTHYLNTFSLKPDQTISSLSRGMKMKFSLALALSHHAELLIMDEPTSGLDPLVRKQFIEILKEYMAQGGKAVFYSTHNTSDLDKAADILVMIDHGKILFEEDKDMLLESHRLVKGKGILPAETKKLFLKVEQAKYGFTGVTNQVEQTRSMFPDAVFERVTVEDIMLAHIKEGKSI